MLEKLMKSAALVFAVGALAACSKINLENYEKLKAGMNKQEVEQIIGAASECTETLGTESCLWGSKEAKHIKVNFVAGNAVLFSHQGL